MSGAERQRAAYTPAEKSSRQRWRYSRGSRCLLVPLRAYAEAKLADDLIEGGWLIEAECDSKIAIGEALGAAADACALEIKLRRRKNP